MLVSPFFFYRNASSVCTPATKSSFTVLEISESREQEEQQQEEEEEEQELDAPFCVLQDKDLLRKSQNSGLYVLDLIERGALEPDPSLYNRLLNKCALLGKLREGRIVHAHFLRSQFSHYLVIQNMVVNMYGKCGSVDDAREVFDDMPTRDMVTWTALITGYSQNGRPHDALILFPQMLRLGLQPNQFTFSSLLKAAGAVPSDMDGAALN
ncbi:hypothetical protein U1Q18_043301 [Sarracenia purpurea var. burkii]